MHKQNFATQPRDREEAWRFDENLHATGIPSAAPNGQNEPLHLGSSSANTYDPPIWEADVSSNCSEMASGYSGYWSRCAARCPRLTLGHRRRRREWGRRHRVWDLRQWRHCIFIDESRFSLYHSDGRVRLRRRQGERLIDACVQPNDGNRGPSVMVCGAIHHGRGVSWSWWMEPWTGIGTSRSWGIKCHGRRGCLYVTMCTSKTMPRPIQHVIRQSFWTNRMLRSWTGQLEVQTWT